MLWEFSVSSEKCNLYRRKGIFFFNTVVPVSLLIHNFGHALPLVKVLIVNGWYFPNDVPLGQSIQLPFIKMCVWGHVDPQRLFHNSIKDTFLH